VALESTASAGRVSLLVVSAAVREQAQNIFRSNALLIVLSLWNTGAVVPPILGAVADAHGRYGTALAMVVPMCFFIAAYSYPLAVNFIPAYRIPADKFSTTKIGLENVHTVDEESNTDSPKEKSETAELEHEKGGMEHSPEIRMDHK